MICDVCDSLCVRYVTRNKSNNNLTDPNNQVKNYIGMSEHGCKLLSTDFKGVSPFLSITGQLGRENSIQ